MPLFKRKTDSRKSNSPIKEKKHVQSLSSEDSLEKTSCPSAVSPSVNIINGDHVDRSPYGWGERPTSLLLDLNCGAPDIDGCSLLNDPLKPQTPMVTASRLSKTLEEVIHDKEALPHYIQYMNSVGVQHYIKFWLDAESFHALSLTRMHSYSTKTSIHPTNTYNIPSSNYGEEVANVETKHEDGDDSKHVRVSCDNLCTNNEKLDSKDCKAADQAHPAGQDTNTNPPHLSSHINSSCSSPSSANSRNQADISCGDGCVIEEGVQSASLCSASLTQTPCSTQQLADKSQHDSFQTRLKKSIARDAVNIFSKYLAHDASLPIPISEELRNETISKICLEDGDVDPRCFTSCQTFIVDLMKKDYFVGFLTSEYHCKHQIDILTASKVNIADIIYNEVALFYFSEFMETEGMGKLLQCFLAIHNFQQQLTEQYGTYDSLEAQKDAMVIYDKYFSLQATSPLGFNNEVRFEVECNICREGGPLPDCFATAKRQVLRTMEKIHFPNFLKNDLYFKYLGELINTIQTQDMPGVRRKRTGSDASSEHSVGSHSSENVTISAKNTLLAAANQSVNHMRKAFNKIEDDMHIDGALFNPDELWKRPQAGKMSLGKINEVGQFLSELEPEPDVEKKKKGTFILKHKREKEKTQEEMALQIAQMIISDVTTQTTNELDTSLHAL